MYIVMVANSSIVTSPSHKLLLQLFFAQVLMSEFLKFIPNIIVLCVGIFGWMELLSGLKSESKLV